MQIHLRNAGDKTAKVVIEKVLYFEPLLSVGRNASIQYSVQDGDETQFIDVDENGDFVYGAETYDFCEVFAQPTERRN